MKTTITLSLFLSFWAFAGCSQSENQELSELAEVPLELLDSLVVDVLDPLELDDYHEGKGLYLMRGKSRAVYLVDSNGKVLHKPDIIGNGPDQVGGLAMGCQFLGDDRVICMSANSKFHVYDLDFNEKVREIPSPLVALNTMVLNKYRLPFRATLNNAEPHIFGVEINAFSYADINPHKLHEAFYGQAKVVFHHNVNKEELIFLESYPTQWIPRQEAFYVGESFPLADFNRTTQEYALLPGVGDQLFVFDGLENQNLKHTIDLSHPERAPLSAWVTDGFNNQFGSYPRFQDLRMFGDFQLVKFYTQVPENVHKELRAANENYFGSPEWKEALGKYFRPYYILAKGGKQVGIINEYPAHGHLDYVSSEGVVYLNDNLSPTIERDYNVFYKVRIAD
jgi:hypothetical protein